MIEIIEAEYINNYKIKLIFNDGAIGEADLKEVIFNEPREIFKPLKNIENFKNFKLKFSTIVWNNELDLAPEFLYFQAFKNEPKLKDKFIQWGYTD